MDGEDIYHAMLGALTDHAKAIKEDAPRVAPGMIAVAPFDAENTDGEPVRVVGIVTNPGLDMLEFVVVKTADDGEMFPTTEGSVWPVARKEAA